MNRLGLTPLAELRFWITAIVVLLPVAALAYVSMAAEWIYFASTQRTFRPNLWR